MLVVPLFFPVSQKAGISGGLLEYSQQDFKHQEKGECIFSFVDSENLCLDYFFTQKIGQVLVTEQLRIGLISRIHNGFVFNKIMSISIPNQK